MDIITPRTLADALRDFRERGDDRWANDDELEDIVMLMVEGYLDEMGFTPEDIEEILA